MTPGPVRLAVALLALATGGCTGLAGEQRAAGVDAILSGVASPPRPFQGETPFGMSRNAVLVDAVLGGPTASRLVLDTGAPMTVAPAVARRLDLAPAGEVTLADPEAGTKLAAVLRLPRVAVAGLAFRDVGAVRDWPGPPSPLACLSDSGLLGATLLQAATWQLDFHAGRLTVASDAGRISGGESALRLPFQRADASGSPRVGIELSNVGRTSALVDLGYNGSIAMPLDLYRRAGGSLSADTPFQTGSGAATVLGYGEETVYVGRLPSLSIGGLRLRDVPVLTGTRVSDFHIGVAFLRHFRVTLDWHDDVLHLERRDPVRTLYDPFASYGFAPVLRDDQVVVGALWHPGAAVRAGLREGDLLIALDGREIHPDFDTYCALLEALALYGNRSDSVLLTVKRGDRRLTATLERSPLAPPRVER